jgi:hypothetical protein
MTSELVRSRWLPQARLLLGLVRLVRLAGLVAANVACNQAPATDVFSVAGRLPGPGGAVEVDFSDARSRGEWWPCEGRLTAQACVGDAHVNVFLGLPVFESVDDLGADRCVFNGVASGAFEILKNRFDNNQDATVPRDVSAFILVGSDDNGDGFVATKNTAETTGIARVVGGTLTLFSLTGFDAPLSMRLEGKTEAGDDVDVTFLGPMTVPTVVPPLEGPATCVASQ